FAAVILAQWALLEQLAADLPDGSVPFCLAVILLGVAGLVLYAGWASLTNMAIVIASALAGIAPLAWWRRADTSGAMPAVAIMLPGLLLTTKLLIETTIPWYAFALPALAPLFLAEVLP